MDNKELFVNICQDKIKRAGLVDLLTWLEKSDFYTCPASTRFHGSYESGLLEHSLNVYNEFVRLLKAYPEIHVSDESAAIMSLFHDLCKVNMYVTEKRNRKNESGLWETYDAYTIKEKFCFGGHGSKSVFIIQNYIKLTPEEAAAINCHMNLWDGNKDVGNAYQMFPAAWLLHVADEAATYVDENERVSNESKS